MKIWKKRTNPLSLDPLALMLYSDWLKPLASLLLSNIFSRELTLDLGFALIFFTRIFSAVLVDEELEHKIIFSGGGGSCFFDEFPTSASLFFLIVTRSGEK